MYKFLPRNEKVKKMKIPKSTPGCHILPPNSDGLGFRYDTYDPNFFKEKITKERYLQTAFNATKLC